MRKLLSNLMLVLSAVVAIVVALPALAGADTTTPTVTSTTPTVTTTTPTVTTTPTGNPSAPPQFYEKTYRLDVNLQDVTGSVYSTTLSDLPASVPWPAQQWIAYNVDTATFDIESKAARCFIVTTKTASVPCTQIQKLVDDSADGGVEAAVLVQPVNAPGGMSFAAKKITVWLDASGNDVQPPADGGSPGGDTPPPPVPAKFYSKNIRLNVNLQDAQAGPVFDAVLNEIPSSVPSSFRSYLEAVLDASTFEIDGSHATCFVVRHDVQNQVSCATVATWVDQAADGGIDAVILARAVDGAELSYAAKKITVRL
jgi:hypothetical protein